MGKRSWHATLLWFRITQPDGHSIAVKIKQTDVQGKNRIWPQYLTIQMNGRGGDASQTVYVDKKDLTVTIGGTEPLYIFTQQ